MARFSRGRSGGKQRRAHHHRHLLPTAGSPLESSAIALVLCLRMKKIIALFFLGCSSGHFAAGSMLWSGPSITPAEAVEKATASTDGISGIFELVVQSVEVVGDNVVL